MKKLMFVALLSAAMFIIGCGGAVELDAPEIDTVIMGDDYVTVGWIVDTAVEDDADFSGYNVYVYTDTTDLMNENGEDLNKDNATVITDNTYTIEDLDDTLVYYIQVRTVNVDDKVGSYNLDVPYVEASPRPEFTVHLKLELSSANQNEDSCGLRFETAAVTSESLDVFPGADVFFEMFTNVEDTTQVNSASRRTATGFTPRATDMYNYGQEDFETFYEFDESDVDLDHVAFVVGDLIVFQTEEGNYVKLVIDAYDDINETIDVTYAYQNIPDYPFFSKGITRNED